MNEKQRGDSLFLVPEGKGYVLKAVRVRHTSNAVLSPAVSSLSCLIVGEICEMISE